MGIETLLTIKKCTVSEVEAASNILDILGEYAQELAIDGLPHPSAKMEMYKQLESTGMLHPIGAYFGNTLVGIINVLMVMNPHYGIIIAVSESFFVAKSYRKTGAGLKLLHAAEEHAKLLGSPGLFVSAPSQGPLAEVLPNTGYAETGRTFFKGFANA